MADFKLTAKVLVTEATVQAKALSKLKNIKIKVNSKALGQASQQAQTLARTLQDVSKRANQLNKSMGGVGRTSGGVNKVNRSVRQLGQSTAQAAKGGKDMVTMFEEIGRRALAFRVAATFINTFTDSVSDAIQFLRTFDQELTDVAKIGNQSSQELEAIGDALLSMAAKWGAAAEETISQFKTFIQAGFDAARAMGFTEQATIGAAGTTLQLNKATELLIQTMKVFGNSDADAIFNKIAVAESSAAVTAADVQDAMKRSAATFKAVNASVDDMIGLISSLQETSRRGGAVVGTAFRTINTRIFAGKTRKEVEKLGVAVTDYAGNLRPLIDVLSDLQLRFKGLTKEEQVQAATLIAGRRQFESFLQIINNVDRAQELATKSSKANKEAMERAQMQSDTLNGRLNTLRDTFLKMVTGMEELIPIRDVFKTLISAVNTLVSGFDGAIGKIAILAGLFVGMKAAIPVLKGLGRLVGGIGSALPSLLAGGFGGAAGGLGLGKGQKVQNKYTSPLGFQQTQTTVASPYTTKYDQEGRRQRRPFKQMVASTKALNIAALSLGVTFSTLAGQLDETQGGFEAAGKEGLEMAGAVATAFAFGPILGSLTAFGIGISKIGSAIRASVRSQSAFNMSMALYGNETLAGMESALARAKEAGDAYTISLLEQSVAFTKAEIDIKRSPVIGMQVTKSIEDFIAQIERVSPGVETTMKDLTEKIISSVASAANVDEKTARALVSDKDVISKILTQGPIYTDQFKGLMVDSLEELLNAINEVVGEFQPSINLSPMILGSEDFVRTQSDFNNALKKGALAEKIFSQGITDAMEIRKLQAENELKLADDAVAHQQRMFSTVAGSFADLVGVDFHSIVNAFEGISGQGRSIADIGTAIGKLSHILESEQVDTSKYENFDGEVTKLINTFMEGEKTLVDQRLAIVAFYDEMKAIDLDTTLKNMKDLEDARKREQDVVTSLRDAIANLNIAGGVDGVKDAFDSLNQAIGTGTSDELSELIGVMHDLKNPIAQARRELEQNHKANLQHIDDLNADRMAVEAQIAVLQKKEPSQKRDTELKAKEAEKLKLVASIEKARGQTLSDAGRDLKKIRTAEVKASDELVKAQEKAMESSRELATAVDEWSQSLTEAMDESHADAQENLKEAQLAVVESTKELVDAYNSLKMAQLELGDAVADYRVGTGLAAMQVDIITGNIRGFQAQMDALQNVFNEAANVAEHSNAAYDQTQSQLRSLANAASSAGISFMVSGGQMIRATEITEQKRLELMQQAATKQLEITQRVIDETLSIGQRVFTMGGGDQAGLSRGLSALQNVADQFTSAGGFGGVDINEFGNTLMTLPQSIREEMVNALSFLPSTATLGGLTKEELEKILFGAAVGKSEQAGIEHIAELTDNQVDLIQQIAELDMAGILTAEAGLEEAKKQTQLAENQLKMDEFALKQAHASVQEVRTEIKEAANIMKEVQADVGNTLSERITETTLEDLAARQQEHMARLSTLQSIEANTEDFASSISSLRDAVVNINTAQNVVGGAFGGHVPRNYARGNMSEYTGLVRAYNREKRMGPAGSRPVIANDSELIIPTKYNGNIPNYQAGNTGLLDTDDMEKLLASILDAIRLQTTQQANAVAGFPAGGPVSQRVEATIHVNADQRVKIEGATSVADAVANSVRNALNEHVSPDQVDAISEQVLDLFNVLKDRGLVNSFGQG